MNQEVLKNKSNDIKKRDLMIEEYSEILEQSKKEFMKKWNEKSKTHSNHDNHSECKRDNYEFIQTLGNGAFGTVILTSFKPNKSLVALKILSKEHIIKSKQLQQTYNEKLILECLDYPFILYSKCCFKDNLYIYITLPFIQAGELFHLLRKFKKFIEKLTKFYSVQVLLSLEYLHKCDLIYRDLKPENILLDKDGFIKIADFGFCKMIEMRTWTFCGTPEYLAPEIILNKGYSKAIDYWGLGILIYEMLYGVSPFYHTNQMKMFENITQLKYKFPKNSTTFDCKDLISNLLQSDLSKRYGNLKNGVLDIKKHRWFSTTDWLKY